MQHDFIRLQDHGVTGNGHMAMMEKNSEQIAALLIEWLGASEGPRKR